jgi:hypothetical protein
LKLKGLKFTGRIGFARNIHTTISTVSSSVRHYHIVIVYFSNERFERNYETFFSNTIRVREMWLVRTTEESEHGKQSDLREPVDTRIEKPKTKDGKKTSKN